MLRVKAQRFLDSLQFVARELDIDAFDGFEQWRCPRRSVSQISFKNFANILSNGNLGVDIFRPGKTARKKRRILASNFGDQKLPTALPNVNLNNVLTIKLIAKILRIDQLII